MSQALLSSVLLGLILFGIDRVGLSVLQSAGLVLGVLFLAALIYMATKAASLPAAIYLLFVGAWLATATAQLLGPGLSGVLLTHALPFGVIAAARWGFRALRLAAEIPLFVPVAVILVLSPLLTQDPWVLGSRAGWNLLWLALVSITPLLTLVVVRQLRVSVPESLAAAAHRLETAGAPERNAIEIMKSLQSDSDPEPLDVEKAEIKIAPAFSRKLLDANLGEIATSITRSFKRNIALRLVPLTAGIAVAVGAFIYILAWAAVPVSVAADWTSRSVETTELTLIGVETSLPIGPYLGVSALLAILATVGFLAFALTEDRYSSALSEALVGRPAERAVVLAMPFIYVTRGS